MRSVWVARNLVPSTDYPTLVTVLEQLAQVFRWGFESEALGPAPLRGRERNERREAARAAYLARKPVRESPPKREVANRPPAFDPVALALQLGASDA